MHGSYETIENLQLNISKIMPTRQKTQPYLHTNTEYKMVELSNTYNSWIYSSIVLKVALFTPIL